MKNIFEQQVTNEIIERIGRLTPESRAIWGKMSASQMLAHCNVTYETVFTDRHPKPNSFVRAMLRLFVKRVVVSERPYRKSSPTASYFIVADARDFQAERARLIEYITTTQRLGFAHFDNLESLSFGRLTGHEWNNVFYKHLDHHLAQFGV